MSTLSKYLIAALPLLPLNTWADYDKQYQDCLDANGTVNNSVVAICAEGVSNKAKQEMNRIYQQLFLKFQASAQEDAQQLEATQKAWLIYRNGQCELQGRRVGSPMYHYCPMKMNIERVNELQFLLDNGI
ncbi:lysozyme inhibitor LprI family protein [Pseudomonas sp. NCHU5208]|uniref:lysozyme inhibitor LprI family protein n=1 Tax=unclassified Pseudomonas TaxID=196821 RepID=UPI003F99D8D5